MPTQQNFSMPGPQFGNNENGSGWFDRHYHKIVFALILALLATGAFSFYKSYQERTALLKPAVEDIRADINKATTPAPSANLATNQVKDASQQPEAIKTDKEIIVSPAKGNGLTHLARQALKEYLKDKPELAKELKAEHKIYIEDYLRKNITEAPEILQMIDTVAFSQDLIQNAIDQAQKLTDNQLNNLQKYVPLAPSLNY